MMNPELAKKKIKQLISKIPGPDRKKVIAAFLNMSKARNLREDHVYKARFISQYCEALKDLPRSERKKICKELRNLVRSL
ncbi:MAG: hypothetical protein ACP6IQ_02985 [Candidatus Njordarchaeia archaeon]|nr:hypothetical protein [Candidatus Korarchaeota archaeon]